MDFTSVDLSRLKEVAKKLTEELRNLNGLTEELRNLIKIIKELNLKELTEELRNLNGLIKELRILNEHLENKNISNISRDTPEPSKSIEVSCQRTIKTNIIKNDHQQGR